MAYNGICSEACVGEDETCFGSAPDVNYCAAGKARVCSLVFFRPADEAAWPNGSEKAM